VRVLSLFSGAGGLDLGLERAGMKIVGCVEIDADARKTIEANRPTWPVVEDPRDAPGDLLRLDPRDLIKGLNIAPRELGLLVGGPPCQPFSRSGAWVSGQAPGMRDPRAETLTAFFRVLEAALPAAMLLENVQGIAFSPSAEDESGQPRHGLAVLRAELEAINERNGTNYRPQVLEIDAADFGVPQHRRRLFVFAARDGLQLDFPDATHAVDPVGSQRRLATTWDSLGELDDPSVDEAHLRPAGRWANLLPSIPEGQNYQWHTPRGGGEPLFGWRTRYWSFLLKLAKDRPSWTLQAAPGPATGPFHWRSRLLSVEEMARLQTFPVDYTFHGNYRSARRQIGNAVPSAIGELLGLEIRRQLAGRRVRKRLDMIPTLRDYCPPPLAPRAVPDEYLELAGDHADHPGTGLGPGAEARAPAEVA
jgi:DNA (cytosine-5)-methyltransferase 1